MTPWVKALVANVDRLRSIPGVQEREVTLASCLLTFIQVPWRTLAFLHSDTFHAHNKYKYLKMMAWIMNIMCESAHKQPQYILREANRIYWQIGFGDNAKRSQG